MDYRYVYISLRYIENWLKNLQNSIATLDPAKLNTYARERGEFSYFMEKIEYEIQSFKCSKDSIENYTKFVYLKVMISDVNFYLDRIIKSVLQLFRLKENSFNPIYDIIILTRNNLDSIIETVENSHGIYKYDIEEKTVTILKMIDNQFSTLFEKRQNNSFEIHPVLEQLRCMNLCILNYLRR